jgi:DNA helicase-2/ATP-dependent DNA helicase PcrA
MSVSPEDWVRSSAARLTTEVIGYRAVPDHRSVRRAIAAICSGDPGWSDLVEVIAGANQVGVREMTGLCDLNAVNDLLPYLESVTVDDQDWEDDLDQFRRVWDTFVDRYGFDDRTFANFRQHIARWQRGDNLSGGVRLLTVHKAQGREFRALALAACNEGQIPDFRARTSEDLTAELRVFYVAITRPSRVLLLTRSTSRETRYGPRATEPSPFLDLVWRSP